ncbi:PCI domain containing protein, putative [Entamoeba invadens IP1]|uniref:PCI domain containing protein, putative n=1 Tax=Entamoeba invadens IP1 TaxID=370355 RepID=A0A0A1U5D2_ENTIV|nr:PCI domain containing protein, putative [Entamoeba invadens IP1]ELP89504.1 PCI domain containing protein, putative [Entamoeba invadens IP1]|eukprot:XP_004256275.1 PCI domain containing protein, putative [Entamoeba invadens IP1]
MSDKLEALKQQINKYLEQIKRQSQNGQGPQQVVNQLSVILLQFVDATIEMSIQKGRDNDGEITTTTLDVFRNLLSLVNVSATNATIPIVSSALHFLNYHHNFTEMDNFISSAQNITTNNISLINYCMFNYYAGVTMLIKNMTVEAFNYLSNAIQYLESGTRNYRNCLIPLVVLQLRKGIYPPRSLILENNLEDVYGTLITAVQRGDVATFEKETKRNEVFFIQHCLFLLVESLKLITYRNLFNTARQIVNTTKVPYSAFLNALKEVGKESSEMELEFVMCNLIFKGIMKSQLYHEHKIAVLSPEDAFVFFDQVK